MVAWFGLWGSSASTITQNVALILELKIQILIFNLFSNASSTTNDNKKKFEVFPISDNEANEFAKELPTFE